MWEAIQANRRRSWILVSLMGVLLVLLGTAVGSAVAGPDAAPLGALGAVGLWGGLWAAAALQGDRILLATAGAWKIEKRDHPQLWNVVEEMVLASGLGAMPEVYVIDDDAPNAFAVGRRPERSAVAVTTGLLRLMNRDELQGVVGHEIGHIKNRDSAFMMLVGVMLGAIVILADLFLRMIRFGGGRRSRGGGQVQALVILLAILLSILAPLLARLIYFACSRRREYLADASSARFTRYPEGLASALEKMGAFYRRRRGTPHRVLAPLYIVNPMTALAATGLLSTHPPTEERILILRSMGGRAGYVDYEAAFRKILRGSVIGTRTLSEEGAPVPARAPHPDAAARPEEETALSAAAALELTGRLRGFVPMTCPCGVGIQVPPGLGRDAVRCPRCGNENAVPRAREAGASA
ncbi:MAG: M48 family metallopeptidase, partial [Planctomycetota bacterium]